jgi:hypothetical protein
VTSMVQLFESRCYRDCSSVDTSTATAPVHTTVVKLFTLYRSTHSTTPHCHVTVACHLTTTQLQPVNHLLHHSCSGDWTDGYLLTTSPADRRRVNFAAFAYTTAAFYTSSSSSSSGGGAYTLVTGGTGHVKFWNLHGRCLTAQLGIQQVRQ